MTFIRSYVIPFFVIVTFFIALIAVSARIFLPSDMAAPAPIEETESAIAPKTGTPAKVPQVNAPTLPTSGGITPKIGG